MKSIYTSPLRVFLCLGLLALVGIYQGFHLPISLYPKASKPRITVSVSYGENTPEQFMRSYGESLEASLSSLNTSGLSVQKIRTTYGTSRAEFTIDFDWGVSDTLAYKEVELRTNSFLSSMPKEIRDSLWIWSNSGNSGFLAISFFSEQRSLSDVYDLLEPRLMPQLRKVSDVGEAYLYNPNKQDILIELKADAMASLGLFPRDIEDAVNGALRSEGGGSLTIGTNQMLIQIPRSVKTVEDLKSILVRSRSGRSVILNDIAKVDIRPSLDDVRIFKTSGTPSIILWADPKADGNIKAMSEGAIAAVEKIMPSMPSDIHYRVLVDPSEFIRSAVNKVIFEVILAAFLAVSILFLFIGSLKNTITAAIEIPLSIVMAFILMRIFGMNLNLISLGGLALSAGMNVDASVVVMENIFRHFKGKTGPLDFETRLKIVMTAVKEVRVPVIASTIASLVVFIPLAFTSNLTSSILGDLAKAVVFSHGCSAIIALILVPTVRLWLMKNETQMDFKSPIENFLLRLENFYANSLKWLLSHRLAKASLFIGLSVSLALLLIFVLPRLPKEIMGLPDTDFISLSVHSSDHSKIQQMEAQAEIIESRLLNEYGKNIIYTFTQINGPNNARIMMKLKDKSQMMDLWKKLEASFENTPLLDFGVRPWNPSELPLPDDPHLIVTARAGTAESRVKAIDSLMNALKESHTKLRLWAEPEINQDKMLIVTPHLDQQAAARGSIYLSDIADVARVATSGRQIAKLNVNEKNIYISLRYDNGEIKSIEELSSFPVGVNGKIVPLRAFGKIKTQDGTATIYREDMRELASLAAKTKKGDESEKAKLVTAATQVVQDWQKNYKGAAQVSIEESEKDLKDAIHQLMWAVALSILLIFITMVIQFESFIAALLVLVAIPVGLIGVLSSLFIFNSTLSLNSVLGVILLNGLAVANSIILVDFIRRAVLEGSTPEEAALAAARKRLRPILITSLTTIAGMLPIAIGHGDGGRILQPLGIAVTGGLWFSTLMTLYLVPTLQTMYLEARGIQKMKLKKVFSLRSRKAGSAL
ncbi:MAG: efflux RND transporter permease subunit [Deltaproteobacteria bacterium]|nr:efflux RND transporter permease subunit [Deltaproteobacteria bacterium]